jgi:starch-binding outer membrane protein, SusD/RagB family
MPYMTTYRTRPHWGRRCAALAALGVLAGCSPEAVLEVEDPDVLTPESLSLPALVAGTASAFQIGFSGGGDLSNGGHEGIVNLSGLFVDEFIHAETFPDRQSIDQRQVEPGNGSMKGVFFDLAQARAVADLASRRFNEQDQGGAGHADVLNLGAFSYMLFAETFCSGVPFSTLTDDGIEFGQPQTRDEMLAIAVAKFDSALTFATAESNTAQQNLARIGKGRALLNLGQFTQAAQAVAGVPTSFEFLVEGSSNSARQNNGVWNYTVNFFGFAVPDAEGGNGPAFLTDADPRAPWVDVGDVGFDGETPFFSQQKYPDKASNVSLANGTDARLIEAEAALRAGNAGTMLTILNTLRSNAGLTPLTLPATGAAREDLLFEERAYWTYLTGQRMGSLRRLVRQYGRQQQDVFPSGAYHKGGSYGSDVTFPVSSDEQNNPNFQGCIDRNA